MQKLNKDLKIFAIKNIDNQQELDDAIALLKNYGCCWKHLLKKEEYNLKFYSGLILIVNEKKITHCHSSYYNTSEVWKKQSSNVYLIDFLEIEKIKRLLTNKYNSDNIYFSDYNK